MQPSTFVPVPYRLRVAFARSGLLNNWRSMPLDAQSSLSYSSITISGSRTLLHEGLWGRVGQDWVGLLQACEPSAYKLAPKGNVLSPSFLSSTPSPASAQLFDTWAGTMAQSRAVGVQDCVCIAFHGTSAYLACCRMAAFTASSCCCCESSRKSRPYMTCRQARRPCIRTTRPDQKMERVQQDMPGCHDIAHSPSARGAAIITGARSPQVLNSAWPHQEAP